jgi:hypothetical protein
VFSVLSTCSPKSQDRVHRGARRSPGDVLKERE